MKIRSDQNNLMDPVIRQLFGYRDTFVSSPNNVTIFDYHSSWLACRILRPCECEFESDSSPLLSSSPLARLLIFPNLFCWSTRPNAALLSMYCVRDRDAPHPPTASANSRDCPFGAETRFSHSCPVSRARSVFSCKSHKKT